MNVCVCVICLFYSDKMYQSVFTKEKVEEYISQR